MNNFFQLERESKEFREVLSKSGATGIPKSTCFDVITKFRDEAESFYNVINSCPVERLVRNTLILAMHSKSSSRDIATSISLIWSTTVSQQTVLKILDISGSIAAELNKELDLAPVESGLLDEIFQKSTPLLVFADAASSSLVLKEATDRSGASWQAFLTELRQLGLDPQTLATDGASGLLKGVKEVFGSATLVRDLFHVLQKLSKAAKVMENTCYRMLFESYQLEQNGDAHLAKVAMASFDEAADIFDLYEQSLKDFKRASQLASPETDADYITSEELLKIIVSTRDLLSLFTEKFSKHKSVKAAWSYLNCGATEIIAYKKKIEDLVESAFGKQFKQVVLSHICPMIEYINQYLRAHDSVATREVWGKKIADLRQRLRSYSVIDQDEVDKAINTVWAIGLKSVKSNSLVESVNSVIRAYLTTYKSIPTWFCALFTFFRNHNVYARGKRAKKCPLQLLSGEPPIDWIDKIIETFPLGKLRSSLPAIPGYFNPEWDKANRQPRKSLELIPANRASG